MVRGAIDILDVRFDSLWTLSRDDFMPWNQTLVIDSRVTIFNNDPCWSTKIKLPMEIFADVRIGQPIIYINSLYRVGLAINQESAGLIMLV